MLELLADMSQAARTHLHVHRPDRYFVVFLGTTLAACSGLLYLGRSGTFYLDEWTFITERSLTFADLLRPHNEHWSAMLVVVYRILFQLVGLHSYLPYLATLVTLHAVVAIGVYRLLRMRNEPFAALAGGALVLLLGSGAEDLFWAFQIGFVGATAAGVWALVLLEEPASRRRLVGAASLLTIGCATSGVGLWFLVAAGLELLVDPRTRRRIWVAVVPGLVYIAWFVLFGRDALWRNGSPLDIVTLAHLPDFVWTGAGGMLGKLTGWGPDPGRILVVAAVAAVGWRMMRGERVPARGIATMASVVVAFLLVGLVRSQGGTELADASRYVYPTGILAILGLSAWLGRPTTEGDRVVRWAAIGTVTTVALLVNFNSMLGLRDYFAARAAETRATVGWVEQYPNSPAIDQSQSLFPLPNPHDLRLLVAWAGSPTRDDLLPGVVRPIQPAVRDRSLVNLVRNAFQIEPSGETPSGTAVAPSVIDSRDVSAHDVGSCLAANPSGSQPYLVVRAPDGAIGTLTGPAGSTVSVGLGHAIDPAADSGRQTVLTEQPTSMHLPRLGDGTPWRVRFDLPSGTGPYMICLFSPSG